MVFFKQRCIHILVSSNIGSSSYKKSNLDSTRLCFISGAQFEEKNYSTSYIPTTNSTVTRNQELAIDAGSAPVFNSEEGTMYAEFAALHSKQS